MDCSLISLVDRALEEALPPSEQTLIEAARYALFSGGKRIRPVLTLLCAQLCGSPYEKALPAACAIELVHTYSLVHDDLPCMDDDDYRRGKPTVHRVYGEAMGVLVGDFLLTKAFELVAQEPAAVILTLARAAGSDGMLGGQVLDIQESKQIEELHAKKTGALFWAAATIGALVAGTDEMKIGQFGAHFGLLFQLADDLLDGDHPLGQEAGERHFHACHQECLSLLDSFDGGVQPLKKLIDELVARVTENQKQSTLGVHET